MNLRLFVRQIMARNKKRDAAGSQENSRKRKKVDATPATELKADNDGELPDIVVPEQVRAMTGCIHSIEQPLS